MLQQFIVNYGYIAIFFALMIEGEIALIIGGFLAYLGYLSLPGVILVGFLGSVFCDHSYFFAGRWKENPSIEKRPKLKEKASWIYKLIEKYHDWVVVLFRFAYGFRAIVPFALGSCDVKLKRFSAFNLLGAILWSLVWGVGGYFFGSALEVIFGKIRSFEMEVIGVLVLVAIILWAIVTYRKNKLLKTIVINSSKVV
jgi:membrane protein DedA with SNARE-associated domain